MYWLKRAVYKIGRESRTAGKRLAWRIFYGKRFSMGKDWKIRENTEIELTGRGRISIGDGMITRSGVSILVDGGDLRVGDHVFFNHGVSITCLKEISIGCGCKIGNNVVIVDHDHDYRGSLEDMVSSPVFIGNRVWIGANAVITRGVSIGQGSVIGAGSVVTGDIPPYCVAAGVPARVIKYILEGCEEFEACGSRRGERQESLPGLQPAERKERRDIGCVEDRR